MSGFTRHFSGSFLVLTITLFAALVFWPVPVSEGQSSLTTFWGPETFVRGKGKPVTETKEISVEGFEAPFILHLRNGDEGGNNRVSSAHVWLNGQLLFGPWAFSQQEPGYTVEVELTNPSTLVVQVASKPGSHLTIWIEGTPASQIVGPEGGILEFDNGVTLNFSPGAVTENTPIRVTELSCDEVDAIITQRDRDFSSHARRCLGGFVGEPDGLEFAFPVIATIPVLPVEPGEVVVQIHVDKDKETYWPTDTVLNYFGDEGTAEMQIWGFSGNAAAGQKPNCAEETCVEQEQKCRECATWNESDCAFLDDIQPSCCTVPHKVRVTCRPQIADCYCCKELRAEIVSQMAEFSLDDCLLATGKTTVTFPLCDPPGPFEDPQYGKSKGCPKDMVFKIGIEPPSPHILVCEEADLTASITGERKDGTKLFSSPDFQDAEWKSFDDTYAVFDKASENGVVWGLKPGVATITASAPGGGVEPGEAGLTIHPRTAALDVTHLVLEGNVTSEPLHMIVEGLCGEGGLEECQVDWVSSNPDVTTVDAEGRVTAHCEGEAIIKGYLKTDHHVKWCKWDFTAQASVEAKFDLYIEPSDGVDLNVGEEYELNTYCSGFTACPNEVEWSNDWPSKVSVTNLGAGRAKVKALEEGTVNVFATSLDECDNEIGDVVTIIITGCFVHLQDPNLEQAVRKALPVVLGADEPITCHHATLLEELNASSLNINNLAGLENFVNLHTLHLSNNNISDIRPLAGLEKLYILNLSTNIIANISSLSNLENLAVLGLGGNPLTDLTPLSGKTYGSLYLGNLPIKSISALSSVNVLSHLVLSDNEISDISPISHMTKLRQLDLDRTLVSGFRQIRNLTSLVLLSCNECLSVENLSGLENLTELTHLYLSMGRIRDPNGLISDIRPLASHAKLHILHLENNMIVDVSPLEHLTNLGHLYLTDNYIEDIHPLALNTGLAAGDYVFLRNNYLGRADGCHLCSECPIADATDCQDVETLLSRGVRLNLGDQCCDGDFGRSCRSTICGVVW